MEVNKSSEVDVAGANGKERLEGVQPVLDNAVCSLDASHVLAWDEIANLTAETGSPAETLMNVVALIARRFGTDVCSAYLMEPDRANLVLAATVGLRPECIGKLRMGIHEGLTGLVAGQVRPVRAERMALVTPWICSGRRGWRSESRWPRWWCRRQLLITRVGTSRTAQRDQAAALTRCVSARREGVRGSRTHAGGETTRSEWICEC